MGLLLLVTTQCAGGTVNFMSAICGIANSNSVLLTPLVSRWYFEGGVWCKLSEWGVCGRLDCRVGGWVVIVFKVKAVVGVKFDSSCQSLVAVILIS